MQLTARIANTLWSASNLPAYWRFQRALRKPEQVQERKLQAYLTENAETAFGKAHNFETIRTYEEFTRRVPLGDYDSFEPWITRIRRGERNVLTREAVTHLVPTSGSTGARKLIPFTAGLQREFNQAIAPWLVQLQRQAPGLLGGTAYWSITPMLGDRVAEESAVPIGFDADTAYLGGMRQRLAEAIMAVPPNLPQATSLAAFRYNTLLYLLRCEDLRLISVWHPSFFTLLLDALPENWERLLNDIAHGIKHLPPHPRRAEQLRAADPHQPSVLWPELRVISCWGDGPASFSATQLHKTFPKATLQPKGLIATEAFLTLPFGRDYPLAIESHFFEFIDDAGQVIPAGSLHTGEEYEIVVTTGGGLWRYNLGDRVRVTGWLEKTPSLQFLYRAGNVSDRFGEKLSELFVNECLREVFRNALPKFALLAPDETGGTCSYTLYLEGEARPHWVNALDSALRHNPHYAYCRDLGQLRPLRLFIISRQGFENFAKRQGAQGARLGDIKPTSLSTHNGWSNVFLGAYVEAATSISNFQREIVDVRGLTL